MARNALMEFLQSASNEAAGAISGPVDLLGMGLRGMGVPVPKNALLSSDWMAQRGLTRPVQQGAAQVAGATAGLLSPFAAAAKAPQIAAGLLQAGRNAAAPATLNKQRGIFMGDLSKTWDAGAAQKAQALEKAGADPRAIWQETGTFKGADGKWRQEIDDSAARMSGVLPEDAMSQAYKSGGIEEAKRLQAYVPPYLQEGTREVGDVFSHRGLTEAYPWATQHRNYKLDAANPVIGEGSYSPNTGVVSLSRANEPTARSAMLHELQHAVQEGQGFSRGGSVEWAAQEKGRLSARISHLNQELSEAARAMDKFPTGSSQHAEFKKMYEAAMSEKMGMNPSLVQGDAFNSYKRLAGEAEARAVQKRMNMNALQRRQAFPLDSYDVPVDQLIIR